MNLRCSVDVAARYRSASQIARVVSENWCARELYCPACDSDCLRGSQANRPAVDFACEGCNHAFQLKALKHWNQSKIVDAAYDSMISAIRSDTAPNLLVMQYSDSWLVQNLLLVPRFFFSESVIQKRRPLATTARRAGWVGCNILLGEIPTDGRIQIVSDGVARRREDVRHEFSRMRQLAQLPPSLRGWTLDLLRAIRRLDKQDFSLQELYGFEPELQALHPENRNVRPKIRQQLQVLRDLKLLDFIAPGFYRLRD